MSQEKRVASIGAVIVLVVLWVGIAPTSHPRAAGAVHVVGTFTSVLNAVNISQQTVGNLVLMSRYSVSTFHGPCEQPPCTSGLEGTSGSLQNAVRDDYVEKTAFQTNIGSYFGTLNGIKGSFATISHVEINRQACSTPTPEMPTSTCPLSPPLPLEGNLTVVAGSGLGGLAGICGGGPFRSVLDADGNNTGVTAYDFTFRFGRDCQAGD